MWPGFQWICTGIQSGLAVPGKLWARHLNLEHAAQHQTACQLRAPRPSHGSWKIIATLRLVHAAMSCSTCPGLTLMDWLKPGYNWAALCCGIPELPQTMLDTVA